MGSAVFNVLFVIGVCAFTAPKPLELTWWPLARDCSYYAVTLAVLAVFFLPISRQRVEWFEAMTLFLLYIGYVVVMKYNQSMHRAIVRRVGALTAPKGAGHGVEAPDDAPPAVDDAPPGPARYVERRSESESDGAATTETDRVRAESVLRVREEELYRHGFRAGMINILTKDRWDYNDVASITVVNSICGDVQETFGALDVDGNGVLDLSELGALLQGLDADISRRPIEELMASLMSSFFVQHAVAMIKDCKKNEANLEFSTFLPVTLCHRADTCNCLMIIRTKLLGSGMICIL